MSNRFNPMAIFRRTNTPMSPRREERQTTNTAARILREYERMTREHEQANAAQHSQDFARYASMFLDESSSMTPTQMRRMMELMNYGTSIRRSTRRGSNSGGYDLVYKADE